MEHLNSALQPLSPPTLPRAPLRDPSPYPETQRDQGWYYLTLNLAMAADRVELSELTRRAAAAMDRVMLRK